MKYWEAPVARFPYSLNEVVSTFWERYPNTYAMHILSEDVLERTVSRGIIFTRKLIVKKGSSILKRVPRWISRMTDIRVVPVIEESYFDIETKKLTTYTRNVSHLSLFNLHEHCVYKPSETEISHAPFLTDVLRRVQINVHCGRMSSFYEKVLLMGFKKSITNTTKGFFEKLEEKFGMRTSHNEKKPLFKSLKSSPHNIVSHVKCEEKANDM